MDDKIRFAVPLLPSLQTHDKRASSIYFWDYVGLHFKELNEVFAVTTKLATYEFMNTSLNEIEELGLDDRFKKLISQIALKPNDLSCHAYDDKEYQFMAINGTWGIWTTYQYWRWARPSFDVHTLWNLETLIKDKFDDWSSQGQLLGDGSKSHIAGPEAYNRVMSYHFDFSNVITSFKDNFTASRRAWKRAEKDSGRLAAHQQSQATEAEKHRQIVKVNAFKHANSLLELLKTHISAIEDDTVTVASCRKIFDAQNQMTAHNALLKKAFKIK